MPESMNPEPQKLSDEDARRHARRTAEDMVPLGLRNRHQLIDLFTEDQLIFGPPEVRREDDPYRERRARGARSLRRRKQRARRLRYIPSFTRHGRLTKMTLLLLDAQDRGDRDEIARLKQELERLVRPEG